MAVDVDESRFDEGSQPPRCRGAVKGERDLERTGDLRFGVVRSQFGPGSIS